MKKIFFFLSTMCACTQVRGGDGVSALTIGTPGRHPIYPFIKAAPVSWNAGQYKQYTIQYSTDLAAWEPSEETYLGNGLETQSWEPLWDSVGYFRLSITPIPVAVNGAYFVMSDGRRIYRDLSGTGPLLVLIHGGVQTSNSWNGQLLHFASSYRVLRFDIRGFGRSEAEDDAAKDPWNWTWNETQRATLDLKELLDEVSTGPVNICGLSMGSAIAAQFAALYPERVNKLVLASPWELSTFPRDLPKLQMLNNLAAKTRVLLGADEPWGSDSEYQWASTNGYTVSAQTIPDAGHNINTDQPSAFNTAVQQFLSAP